MREEYVLLERTIKNHQRTLEEEWFDGLKRGVKSFFGGGLSSSDLEDTAAEKATAEKGANTEEFVKKIKELDAYNKNLGKYLKTDPSTLGTVSKQLNDYVQTFREALEAWKASPDNTKSARAPLLKQAFDDLRYVLSSYLYLIGNASRTLNSLTRGTEFAKKATIPDQQTSAPKPPPSGKPRDVMGRVAPPSTTATGGLRLESKRRKG